MESHIPKVNEDICWSIEQEMIDDKYLVNTARHIAKNNPTIAGFVHSFIGKLPPCCGKAAMIASFTIYRLVESQMQADKMKNELKIRE